jgi:hypothetical protein
MYWRIHKYGPLDILKKYWLHIVLIVSVLFNFLLMVTRPNPKKTIPVDVKQQMDQFARQVTNHILDTSYISYQAATNALLDKDTGELDKPVVIYMRQQQILPNSEEELKAEIQTYTEKKRVVAIRIDNVDIGEPRPISDSQSLIPIDVSGVIAVHSADEADQPRSFHFKYLMGVRKSGVPIVATFQDLSPPG